MTIKELPFGLHLRLATEEDVSEIYGLLDTALKDASVPNHLGTFTDVKEQMIELVTSPDTLVLLLGDESKVVGVLAAAKIAGPLLFKPFAAELVWWVAPEARKGTVPLRMLDGYEYWAREKGCVYMKLSLLTQWSRKEHKRIHKVYRKKGFKPFETAYLKDLT